MHFGYDKMIFEGLIKRKEKLIFFSILVFINKEEKKLHNNTSSESS